MGDSETRDGSAGPMVVDEERAEMPVEVQEDVEKEDDDYYEGEEHDAEVMERIEVEVEVEAEHGEHDPEINKIMEGAEIYADGKRGLKRSRED